MILDDVAGPKTWKVLYDTLIPSEEDRYIAWMLASLTPWTTIPLAKNGDPYAVRALKDGLKADNSVSKLATGAFKNYMKVASFKDSVNKGARAKDYTIERQIAGLMIRKWEAQNGGSWRQHALLALLVESMSSNSEGYQRIFAVSFNPHWANPKRKYCLTRRETMLSPSILPSQHFTNLKTGVERSYFSYKSSRSS